MEELNLKNYDTTSNINKAVEKARTNLHNAIDIYGRDSDEAVFASQKLDVVIVDAYKEQLNASND
jgi:hypothetical protein